MRRGTREEAQHAFREFIRKNRNTIENTEEYLKLLRKEIGNAYVDPFLIPTTWRKNWRAHELFLPQARAITPTDIKRQIQFTPEEIQTRVSLAFSCKLFSGAFRSLSKKWKSN